MDENEFMYRMMTAMRRMEKDESKPEKHYGFGLPKAYRIVDATTGIVVLAAEHYQTAQRIVVEKSEETGHHFETRAMWT